MVEDSALRGQLTLRIVGRDGVLVAERTYKNTIVYSGRLLVAQMFAGAPDGQPRPRVSHIAVGTGGDRVDGRQDRLARERAPRRPLGAATYTELTEATPAGPLLRVRVGLTASFDYGEANGPDPLQEAGLFNAEADGVMYNRVVFDPVTKTEAFKLTLLWEVVF